MDRMESMEAFSFTPTPDEVIEIIKSLTSVKVVDIAIFKDNVKVILDVINSINSLDEFHNRVGEFEVSEYRIIEELGCMIQPSQVKVADLRVARDLKLRPSNPGSIHTPVEFEKAQVYLASVLRVSKPTFVNVSEIRRAVVVSESMADGLLSDGVHVQYLTADVMPIAVAPDFFSIVYEIKIANYDYRDYCCDVLRRHFMKFLGIN